MTLNIFPPVCADGSNPVNCLVDPCTVERCHGHPDAKCVADYCGGCNARYYENGMEITDCDSEFRTLLFHPS